MKYVLLGAIFLVGCTTKTPGSPTFTLALSPDAKHTISYRSHSYAGASAEYYTLYLNKIDSKNPKFSEQEALISDITASHDARLNPISAVWTSNNEVSLFIVNGMYLQPQKQTISKERLTFIITTAHGDSLLPLLDQAMKKNATLSRQAWRTSRTAE